MGLALELSATAVDLESAPEAVTAELLSLADRAAGRYDAAVRAGDRLSQLIARKEPWSPAAVLAAAEGLARRTDPAAGLLALRLTTATGTRLGWPDPYRQIVSTLRRHPDPAVAEAALDVDTGTA